MSSRKVVIALIISVVAVLVTLTPIMILESRRTPDWQSALTQYLKVSEVYLTHIQTVWAVEAQDVDQLPAAMLLAVPTEWTWESIEQIPPPERIRCIRLERREGGKTARQTLNEPLVISYHDDGLYRSGWVVHEFRAGVSKGEREELFAKMGCSHWERVSIGRK